MSNTAGLELAEG